MIPQNKTLAILALLFLSASSARAGDDAPRVLSHSIEAQVDPKGHSLAAKDELKIVGSGPLSLRLARALRVKEILLDGVALSVPAAKEIGPGLVEYSLPIGADAKTRSLHVSYGGSLFQDSKGTRFSRESIGGSLSATISPEGSYLSPWGGWYPRPRGELASFKLVVSTPKGTECVAEGERVERREKGGRIFTSYVTEIPLDGLHLITGPFEIHERKHGKISLLAFLYPEDKALAEPYLADVERYLTSYESLLGPYPFRKMAVVASFFPAGYGMPSFTYLGRRVMRLPFIRKSSLGHEVCHNWWGNGVLVDPSEGNWCEGLTTFYADYRYERQRSPAAGLGYRRRILSDFASYVKDKSDFPLAQFRARHDFATRAVGYGKCCFLFHMLEARIGTEKFAEAIRGLVRERTGKRTTWSHFRAAFERATGGKLGWFFDQWLKRKGAPHLSLSEVKLSAAGDKVDFKLAARSAWRLRIPMALVISGGKTLRRVIEGDIGPEGRQLSWPLPAGERALSLAVDPDFDVMRSLDSAEVPATLRLAFGARPLTILLSEETEPKLRAAFEHLAKGLAGRLRAKVVILKKGAPIPAGSVMALGGAFGELKALSGSVGGRVSFSGEEYRVDAQSQRGAGGMLVLALKRSAEHVAVVVLARSPEAVAAAGYKLVHYGRYGVLLFDAGRNLAKGVLDAPSSPLKHSFK